MNNLIGAARHIPVAAATTTISISPVTLSAPGRGLPLELRITAPVSGRDLPIVLLSHGHGPSLYLPSKDGYGPIVNFYAERGFAVIQPTHANSRVAGLPADAPGGPLFWRSRVADMTLILDRLDEIEAAVPAIAGRLDHGRIAAVGHSMGGQTVAMLLGARLTDPNDDTARDVNLIEPRIKAGVLLAAPGNGDGLSDFAAKTYSALNPDYAHMTTSVLVVVGDSDVNPHLTVRGADWHADPYRHGPGSDALLTLIGGKHGLGGIAGFDAKETDDEDPDRLAVTQRMTWAYLRSALYADDPTWSRACRALAENAGSLGRVDCK
ncbi:chlorophyllase [Siculibacillus lacustris]|uniref:Chlorophyllase n=1 Tax=Siculibacillus lacustris TaxID=1549641 RepID=A0A4Q9VPJ9_9HYPH|nr:alpha/beta fold hydrolase [Siculibacillus lacustris]TBW37665.1 chlorophyllase [Siculibacillus lacustris]